MKARNNKSVMNRAKAVFEQSGLSLDEVGQRMGFKASSARKGAWQFLNKTTDPRLSTLFKFAEAMSINITELLK